MISVKFREFIHTFHHWYLDPRVQPDYLQLLLAMGVEPVWRDG